jgi:hypothetical protein
MALTACQDLMISSIFIVASSAIQWQARCLISLFLSNSSAHSFSALFVSLPTSSLPHLFGFCKFRLLLTSYLHIYSSFLTHS